LNRQQLEVIAIRAVSQARSNTSVEDDQVELKGEWPGPDKARQLAGAANQLNGDPLIYVIGIDQDGTYRANGDVDPARWWAQFEAKFDDVSPELTDHVTVDLGNGETVVALAFATDRAPYVVKNSTGRGPELEVPIRVATRTRSAKRSELLRILAPRAARPLLLLLDASFTARPDVNREGDDETDLHLVARVFVESTPTAGAFFPAHDVAGKLTVHRGYSETVHLNYGGDPNALQYLVSGLRKETPVRWRSAPGVDFRPDGIIAAGPGVASISFRGTGSGVLSDALASAETKITMTLSFGVAGSERPIQLKCVFTAYTDPDGGPMEWMFRAPTRSVDETE